MSYFVLERVSGMMAITACVLAIIMSGSFARGQLVTTEDYNDIFVRLYHGMKLDSNYSDVRKENVCALASGFDQSLPTVLFIHGYTDSVKSDATLTTVDAYIKHGGYNIMAVDWSKVAQHIYSFVTSANIEGVAGVILQMIEQMLTCFLTVTRFHVVGHSLGAHIAGLIGSQLSQTLPLITGLDPAGPVFYALRRHIQKDDAMRVHIMHTNPLMFGTVRYVGALEFYANGGATIQPGCILYQQSQTISEYLQCSHLRAVVLHAAVVQNAAQIIGVKCNSSHDYECGRCNYTDTVIWDDLDGIASTGRYFFDTNSSWPFGKGLEGIPKKHGFPLFCL